VPDPVAVDLAAFEEAARVLASRGRPVCAYIYDLAHLRRHARLARTSLPPGARLLYAVKANAEPAVLRTLTAVVDGFEVASAGEMEKVRAVSSTATIAFGGPGKTDAELARAIDLGVDVVHVESMNELRRLEDAARRASRPTDVLLRVNLADGLPGATLTMGGPTQFGIDEAQLPEAVDAARRCGTLTLRGFHLHLVSNQLDASAHARLVGRYVDRSVSWAREHGWRCRW
jgi:2-[(L-alanin-3-ylcarbamoyl)methyl]-2-hydroxybutanedioate decarboxylase